MIDKLISELESVEDIYASDDFLDKWISDVEASNKLDESAKGAVITLLNKGKYPLPVVKPYGENAPTVTVLGVTTLINELRMLS